MPHARRGESRAREEVPMLRLLAILSMVAFTGCAQTGTHTAYDAVTSWFYSPTFYDLCLLHVSQERQLEDMERAEAFCAELDARRRAR